VKGLGSVAIDTKKKERDFERLTLSDENVIKYLILFRSKVDTSHNSNTNIDINQAGDMFEFNQELIALYSSLDEAVKAVELRDKDLRLLELVFEGHTISDIIKHYNYPQKTAYRILDRIVEKIVEENNASWRYSMRRQGYIK
jgi:hypothetical protein